MTQPRRTPVAVVEESLEPPIGLEDVGAIRRAVAQLMDRILIDVQRAGLDLDDCVLERSVGLRKDGHPGLEWVAMESITSAGWAETIGGSIFERASELDEGGTPTDQGGAAARVSAVRVVAVRVPDFPENAPATG